jgi:hypothetical protein
LEGGCDTGGVGHMPAGAFADCGNGEGLLAFTS